MPTMAHSGVVGLLVCQVLEGEVAYLLAQDQDVARIALIDSPHSEHFGRLLTERGKPPERLASVDDFKASGGLDVVVDVLQVALHMDKQDLQGGVHHAARDLASVVDVLTLGYGMCGNVLDKPETLLADLNRPVVVPRNDDGSIIDDCVCLVLGGTERYLDHVRAEAGTWFLTPGWLRHWETLLVKELHARDVATVKWIFDRTGYKRALMIETDANGRDPYQAESERFAALFDFYLEKTTGSLHILGRELEEAKRMLTVVRGHGPSSSPTESKGGSRGLQ